MAKISSISFIAPAAAVLLLAVCVPAARAENVRGTAFDIQGKTVPDARVMLMLDYVKQKETKTDPVGDFEFKDVAPGRYELQIKKGRMSLFQRTIFIESGKDVSVYAVLPPARVGEQVEVTASRPAGAPRSAGRNAAARGPGGNVEIPQLVRPLRPKYPPAAVARGIEGEVAIFARINLEGLVVDPLILFSPDAELEQEVLRSLKELRYRPMTLNGIPGESNIELVVNFRLRQ